MKTVIMLVIAFVILGVALAVTPKTNDNVVNENKVEATVEPVKGVTMQQFNDIQEGMSYRQVIVILGSEGEVISSSDMAGYKTVMYQWQGSTALSNMNAMFQNDKMISKAQFGLE